MNCDTFIWGKKYVYWHKRYIDNYGIQFEQIYREPLNSSATEVVYDSALDGAL